MANVYDAIVVGGGHNGLVASSYLAKAGKKVLLLEAAAELGGATASVRAFPEYDARLSRYSYLVALLPDQIVKFPEFALLVGRLGREHDRVGLTLRPTQRKMAVYIPQIIRKSGQQLFDHRV